MSDEGITPEKAAAEAIITGSEDEPFFSMDWGEGQADTFKTADELKDWMQKSALREQDYTRKTQALGARERELQESAKQRESEYEKKIGALKEWQEKMDRYTEAMNRRPEVARELERLASMPASPDDVVDRAQKYSDEKYSELQKRIDELEEDRNRMRLERERDTIYSQLSEKYPEFKPEAIEPVLNSLEENNLAPLIEMAWKASQFNPTAIEQKVVDNLKRNQEAKIPSGNGGSPPVPADTGFDDPKAAYEAALRDLGIDT